MRLLPCAFVLMLILFCADAGAQRNAGKPATDEISRLEIGAGVGVLNATQNKFLPWVVHRDFAFAGAEVSGRFRMTNHLSTRLELLYRVSEKEYGAEYVPLFIDLDTSGYIYHHDRHRTLGGMLHLEYNFGEPNDKLLPFFGAGAGVIRYKYRIDDRYESPVKEPMWVNNDFSENTVAIQFTQGLLYTLNRNWRISQTFFYQYEFNHGRNVMGLMLGVVRRLY